jgi:predicted DsbA family dithiol-disulfide isomerase
LLLQQGQKCSAGIDVPHARGRRPDRGTDHDRCLEEPVRVDIWSDVVCPWCYIGKRRFAAALADFEHRDEVEVVYRSFELDPAFPKDLHTPVLELLATKYRMSPAQARDAEASVAAKAAADGLVFNPDRVMGNTFDAHRLVHLARERGVQEQVLERLFEAYFAEGRPVFAVADLATLGAEAGLDSGEAGQVLKDGGYADAVRADEDQARAFGISGVPFVVLGGKYGVSGAQPAAAFAQALEQAWAG